jgi:hypothetical protein
MGKILYIIRPVFSNMDTTDTLHGNSYQTSQQILLEIKHFPSILVFGTSTLQYISNFSIWERISFQARPWKHKKDKWTKAQKEHWHSKEPIPIYLSVVYDSVNVKKSLLQFSNSSRWHHLHVCVQRIKYFATKHPKRGPNKTYICTASSILLFTQQNTN